MGTDLSPPGLPAGAHSGPWAGSATPPSALGGTVSAARSCRLLPIPYPLAPHPDGRSRQERAFVPRAFPLRGSWPRKGCPSTPPNGPCSPGDIQESCGVTVTLGDIKQGTLYI